MTSTSSVILGQPLNEQRIHKNQHRKGKGTMIELTERREKIVQMIKNQALGKPKDIELKGIFMVEKDEKGTNWTSYLNKSAIEMWEGKLGLGPIKKSS